ncbi:unnamed protein product [Protopolystoma xenopodis]|uniref:RNA 3'-terminal phosphate cyclase domain-containing protein n=1 Tax=Protopolystoma xenopodis TaxID=117903 RepID=A0A448WNA3_9PLAT|nr:unnamed protein product [Protopolystoma xenopodis]
MRIALSLLSSHPVRIINIRSKSTNPGVDDAELSLFKLLDEITNGTIVKINDTGTIVSFFPGNLIGGEFTFSCCTSRGLGYYLEVLLLLALFCKNPTEARLFGVTNNSIDPSVDIIDKVWFKVLAHFLGPVGADGLKIEVIKRGLLPKGGGEILFKAKPCKCIFPINKLRSGKVFRIRGLVWTCRVNPSNNNQMIAGAKDVLTKFLSDVYFTKDHRKSDSCGSSPGFGIILWAETKEGSYFCSQAISEPLGSSLPPVIPVDLGKRAAELLLTEIYRGGHVGSDTQSLAFILMACESGRNASQLLIGLPTLYSIGTLRLIRDFFGVKFDLRYEEQFHRLDKMSNMGDIESSTKANPKPQKSEYHEQKNGDEAKRHLVDPESQHYSGLDKLIVTCFGSGLQHVNQAIR